MTKDTGQKVGQWNKLQQIYDLFGDIPASSDIPLWQINNKRCSKCHAYKPFEEFGKDKNRKDGKYPQCIPCARESQSASIAKPEVRESQRVYQKLWARQPHIKEKYSTHQKNGGRRLTARRSKLKTKYGMTEAQYDEMFSDQGGVCAACRQEFESTKHTHVDHCHTTGVVRGILCNHCNRALGGAKDSVAVLHSLIKYLERADEKISYN